MRLYDRDYFQLTDQELKVINRIVRKEQKSGTFGIDDLLSLPKSYFFSSTYFPNHLLDTDELSYPDAEVHLQAFSKMIDRPYVSERDILSYVRSNQAYFLVASLLGHYDFGHHGAYLFPEFPLSTNHVADYLLIGKNSGGHEFVFIEFESVNGAVTTKDGGLGSVIRRGIKQAEDWDYWLQKHFPSLKSFYDKYRNHDKSLPDEFIEYDRSRIHFVVVAGRRKHYTMSTYRKRRNLLNERDIRLLHYDNLLDSAKAMVEAKNYCKVL